MIEAIDLEKSFGKVQAVRGISFEVRAGEAVGFLGPNGAGKTTTFRMLAGTIGPTSGKIRLAGIELGDDPIAAKRLIGYMAENAPLYPELTGYEYLLYRAELRGVTRNKRRATVTQAAEKARADKMLGTRIAHLSKGYQRRMALADALLGNPPILLLDEPTSGLDPNQVLEVRRLIADLATDHAVMLSTHVLSEVEATCSRAIIVNRGLVVGQGRLNELKAPRKCHEAKLVVRGPHETALSAIHEASGSAPTVLERTADVLTLAVHLGNLPDLAPLIAACIRQQVEVLEATPKRAALDEVFAQLTELADPAGLNQGTELGEEGAD